MTLRHGDRFRTHAPLRHEVGHDRHGVLGPDPQRLRPDDGVRTTYRPCTDSYGRHRGRHVPLELAAQAPGVVWVVQGLVGGDGTRVTALEEGGDRVLSFVLDGPHGNAIASELIEVLGGAAQLGLPLGA